MNWEDLPGCDTVVCKFTQAMYLDDDDEHDDDEDDEEDEDEEDEEVDEDDEEDDEELFKYVCQRYC